MTFILKKLGAAAWVRDTRGGMAEYLILTVVIAVGAIAASQRLREAIVGNFTDTAEVDLVHNDLATGVP